MLYRESLTVPWRHRRLCNRQAQQQVIKLTLRSLQQRFLDDDFKPYDKIF
jgi:hypothetical protein